MRLVFLLFCALAVVCSKSVLKNNALLDPCNGEHDANWNVNTQTCDLGVLIQHFQPECEPLKDDVVMMAIGQSNYVKCGGLYRRFTCFECSGDYTGWLGDGYDELFNYRM